MDCRDLFAHLKRFDAGIIGAGQVWNYLSGHAAQLERVPDDNRQDIFGTAKLVMAKDTGGNLSESEAREQSRHRFNQ